jgi:flagellin
MPLTVSNNTAVAAASHYLGKNQQALQMSIKKLASGSRLIGNSDPGTLSVAMKLNASVTRLVGAKNNVQNGMSFVEVQDGMLTTAGRIVGRMAELKGMATQDPMKSAQDIASYNNEFTDLQVQLHQISQQTFNGASLFASTTTSSGGTQTVFRGTAIQDNTVSIFTSSNGSAGTKISIHRSSLLSALTINTGLAGTNAGNVTQTGYGTTAASNSAAVATTAADVTFASADTTTVLTLDQISMGVFEQALSNVAFLRAQAGGSTSRLTFSAESLAAQETNIRAAVGRIEDVDIAAESANLAKYSILTQAAAAMVAQANTTNDVALMLLR